MCIFTRNVYGYSFPSPLSYVRGQSREPRVPFIDSWIWNKQRTRRATFGCRLINRPREFWTSKPAHKCVPCVHILLYLSGPSETTSPKHRIQSIAFPTFNVPLLPTPTHQVKKYAHRKHNRFYFNKANTVLKLLILLYIIQRILFTNQIG